MGKSTEKRAGQAAVSAGDNLPGRLLGMFCDMVLIRRTEEQLISMFADGEVPGFIHLSIGQEAVSVGVMSCLGVEDTIASTHRGHGHAIAKGLPLDGFFAEILARDTGLCRGRGGSMHVADMSVGMLGANGIVAAGIPISLGSALACKVLNKSSIAVAFFGDGALAEGVVHESLNMAALWRLPLLLVCENNGYGEFLPTSKQLSFALADLAAAYGIPFARIDGNDVEAVAAASGQAVAAVRAGQGPYILECMTTRLRGHYEGDAQKYRDGAELEKQAQLDPINRTAGRLLELGLDEADLNQVRDDVEGRIRAAVATARAAPAPDFALARADVYTTGTSA